MTDTIKTLLIILVIIASFNTANAQLNHQMVSSQGSTSQTTSGAIVTQTIGQTSVTGTYTNTTSKISQGYQQAYWGKIITEQNNPDFNLAIFPNPFDELVTIKYKVDEQINISLYDVAGKLVYKNVLHFLTPQQTITFKTLPSGVYLIKLESKTLIHHTKLIKK